MRTKYLFLSVLVAMTALTADAQETYQSAKLIGNDLNGTARYVGMGGAMEALGADISTISTNPAGVGLFRKGQVSISGGVITQPGVEEQVRTLYSIFRTDGDKTNVSFDQIGVVVPLKVSSRSYLNVAFNYHKSRNFNQILAAVGGMNNASRHKLSAIKYDKVGEWGWNAVDANYQNIFEKEGPDGTKYMDFYTGDATYAFNQSQTGYIGEYDISFSGGINDRVYLGLTVGIHDVNYKSTSHYGEDFKGGPVEFFQPRYEKSYESLKIDGTGFDVKLGAIFFPIDGSPFRIGAYVHTPVFYDLSLSGFSAVGIHDDAVGDAESTNSCTYDYRVNTPWKFGVSLGHTVGNKLALGATYEYSDYGSIDNRVVDGSYYDPYYGDVYESSSSDEIMNRHTEHTLKGVHTLKLGAEYKPIPALALRAGYNYISAAFDENGFRDGSLESPGVGYATSTDYTNWKATNRFTLGAGYQIAKNFNIDVAYQYSKTDGDFYPFMSYSGDSNPDMDCIVTGAKVSNRRGQFLATLSYRF